MYSIEYHIIYLKHNYFTIPTQNMTPIHQIDIRYTLAQAQNDCISSNDIISLEDIQSFCACVNL